MEETLGISTDLVGAPTLSTKAAQRPEIDKILASDMIVPLLVSLPLMFEEAEHMLEFVRVTSHSQRLV